MTEDKIRELAKLTARLNDGRLELIFVIDRAIDCLDCSGDTDRTMPDVTGAIELLNEAMEALR